MDTPSGLDIKSELEEYYADEINHARLYPNLEALATDGLVSKTKLDGRTNSYSLTDQGIKLIQDRREWEQSRVENQLINAKP